MGNQTESQFDEVVQLALFSLGKEKFVIDILKIQEINLMVEITRLPEIPSYYEGIINLRGKVIPVLNLRKRFDMEHKEWDKDTRIIVCSTENYVVGMIVDAVDEVLRINSSIIEPAPGIVTSFDTDYITGIAKFKEQLLIFLDVSRIAKETINDVGSKIQCNNPESSITENNSTITKLDVDCNIGLERSNMMNSIEMIVKKLKDVNSKLSGNTSELETAANEVVSCAKATVKAAEHMTGLTGVQVQNVNQVSATIEETTTAFSEAWKTSSDTNTKLAEMIKTIQIETKSAMKSMEEGIQIVSKSREMADKANSSLNEAVSVSQKAMSIIEQNDSSSSNHVDTKEQEKQTVEQ